MIISMLLSRCRRATLWLQPNQDRGSTTVRSWQTRVQRKSAPTSSERSFWSICPRKCPIQWHRWQVNHFCTLRCRLTDYGHHISLHWVFGLFKTLDSHFHSTCWRAFMQPLAHSSTCFISAFHLHPGGEGHFVYVVSHFGFIFIVLCVSLIMLVCISCCCSIPASTQECMQKICHFWYSSHTCNGFWDI